MRSKRHSEAGGQRETAVRLSDALWSSSSSTAESTIVRAGTRPPREDQLASTLENHGFNAGTVKGAPYLELCGGSWRSSIADLSERSLRAYSDISSLLESIVMLGPEIIGASRVESRPLRDWAALGPL